MSQKAFVTVDGITLSRAQVEKAHQALHEPEPPKQKFFAGDIVKVISSLYCAGQRLLVVDPEDYVGQALREKAGLRGVRPGYVLLTDGKRFWARHQDNLMLVVRLGTVQG